jgi:hypothetical protein
VEDDDDGTFDINGVWAAHFFMGDCFEWLTDWLSGGDNVLDEWGDDKEGDL